MEQSFPEKILRGCLLVSAPYNPATYYAAIVSYAMVLTWGIYWLVIGWSMA